MNNVNNPDLRVKRGKGIFVRFSIFFKFSQGFQGLMAFWVRKLVWGENKRQVMGS